ncbi:gluconolactonase [Vibrio maritimus]|uniref:Gluconolactonase n=1 Tax=Vibrio maritimus TaxID=990268 RepID=A0A090SNL7_9VIBR|nr:gluconolactonase [Vibrio maritimus]
MLVYKRIRATIGESPIWSERNQSIVWVDAAGHEIYTCSSVSGITHRYSVPFDVTAIVPTDNDSWICASKQGLYLLSSEFEVASKITDPCSEQAHLHLNDAVASPNGEIWFGTMNSADLESPDGKLFILHQGQLVEMDHGFSVANGIAFNAALKRAYCSNMFQRKVYEYQLDHSMTRIVRKSVFLEFDESQGYPDGLTIDSLGNLYVCHWDCGVVSYHASSSSHIGKASKLGEISLPVKHATRCTFGGPNLETLYVTTANYELSEDETKRYPHSGCLFAISAPTKGNPEPWVKKEVTLPSLLVAS